MQYLFYAIVVLFVGLSFFMLFAFYRTQHTGLLALSAVYGAAGLAAGYFGLWWPLLAGFVVAWILRLLGLDPDASKGSKGKPADHGRSGSPPGAGSA